MKNKCLVCGSELTYDLRGNCLGCIPCYIKSCEKEDTHYFDLTALKEAVDILKETKPTKI